VAVAADDQLFAGLEAGQLALDLAFASSSSSRLSAANGMKAGLAAILASIFFSSAQPWPVLRCPLPAGPLAVHGLRNNSRGLRCRAAGTGRQGNGGKAAKQNAFHDGFPVREEVGP
jgi:hypothetical protein